MIISWWGCCCNCFILICMGNVNREEYVSKIKHLLTKENQIRWNGRGLYWAVDHELLFI